MLFCFCIQLWWSYISENKCIFHHHKLSNAFHDEDDDNYYTAKIIEVDDVNKLFTLLFFDDGMEVDSYKAWSENV